MLTRYRVLRPAAPAVRTARAAPLQADGGEKQVPGIVPSPPILAAPELEAKAPAPPGPVPLKAGSAKVMAKSVMTGVDAPKDQRLDPVAGKL